MTAQWAVIPMSHAIVGRPHDFIRGDEQSIRLTLLAVGTVERNSFVVIHVAPPLRPPEPCQHLS